MFYRIVFHELKEVLHALIRSSAPADQVNLGIPRGLLRRLDAHLDTEYVIFNVVRFP
jgi:hypothetical protein